MNIVELSEKNINEAINVFRNSKKDFYLALGTEVDDETIRAHLIGDENASITYLLTDKGTCQGVVTVNKSKAEIENFCLNYQIIAESSIIKLMEFAIKQFSAITYVLIWIDSTDTQTAEVIENYGFEYTGEQDYVDKERNILKFKYYFKRKK